MILTGFRRARMSRASTPILCTSTCDRGVVGGRSKQYSRARHAPMFRDVVVEGVLRRFGFARRRSAAGATLQSKERFDRPGKWGASPLLPVVVGRGTREGTLTIM